MAASHDHPTAPCPKPRPRPRPGRLAGVLALLVLGAGALAAQPSRTTLNITLYNTSGGKYTGVIYISWPTFTSADSYAIAAGNRALQVTNGVLSATLVPTDALSGDSANARYTARYALTNGQPLSPPLTEVWDVPSAGPVTSLDQLRAVAPPPYTPTAAPSNGPYITKTVSGALSGEFSLGTLADNSIVTCDVATATCTPRAALYTDVVPLWDSGSCGTDYLRGNGTCDAGTDATPAFSAITTATNTTATLTLGTGGTLTYSGTGVVNANAIRGTVWPAGVDMTEVGYLDGVTSAIQTQLDAKAGGASSLTTAGAVPYVASSGVLGQDANQFTWDATNNRLGIGTGTPSTNIEVVGSTSAPSSELGSLAVTVSGGYRLGIGYDTAGNYGWVQSTRNGVDYSPLSLNGAAGSGPVVVGGASDGGYKLDIQKSGASGTLRVYDQTSSTGESTLYMRLGAGQNGTGSGAAAFTIHRNNGTEFSGIDNAGAFYHSSGTARVFAMGPSGIAVAANAPINWSDTVGDVDTPKDTGIVRASAGVVEINNGTSGTPRDLLLRELIPTTSTQGTCDSSNRGRVVFTAGGAGVADTWAICAKDAADMYAFEDLF